MALKINVHIYSLYSGYYYPRQMVTWLYNLHGFILKVQTFQMIKAQNETLFFLLLLYILSESNGCFCKSL